ncbi:hypothetical protein GN956_G22671 [Arapaima gigas]
MFLVSKGLTGGGMSQWSSIEPPPSKRSCSSTYHDGCQVTLFGSTAAPQRHPAQSAPQERICETCLLTRLSRPLHQSAPCLWQLFVWVRVGVAAAMLSCYQRIDSIQRLSMH